MKKRIILTSVLSIAMCLSLIVGATMAFFGSESKANISVTGANVNVVASIDPATGFTTYSKGKTSEELGYPNGEFENGGTASIDAEGALVLNAISAGDSVKVRVDIYNDSNIRIQYRARVVCEEGEEFLELFEIENDFRHMTWQIAEIGNDLKDEIVEVTIGLPEDVNLEDFEGQTIKFAIVVEAVQANADTIDSTEDAVVYSPENSADGTANGNWLEARFGNTPEETIPAGTTVYLGAGDYTLDEVISIPEGVNLYGVQYGNPAVNWATDEAAEKTVIYAPDTPEERAVKIAGSNTVIDGIMVDGSNRDVKGIRSDDSKPGLTDVAVRNCAVINVANDGIDLNGTDGAVIENNYIQNANDNAIRLGSYYNESGAAYIRNNVIVDVATQGGTINGVIQIEGDGSNNSEMFGDVIVAGNRIEKIVSRHEVNEKTDAGESAITVKNVSNSGVIIIEDNVLTDVEQGIGIYKFSSYDENSKVIIRNNEFSDVGVFSIATCNLNEVGYAQKALVEISNNVFDDSLPSMGHVSVNIPNVYDSAGNTNWQVTVNGTVFDGENYDASIHTLISSKAELFAFARRVSGDSTYVGETVVLTADIDLAGETWTPIGTVLTYPTEDTFRGTFDGQNHTIYNMHAVSTKTPVYDVAGFFGTINGTVKNLNFENAVVEGTHYTGVVVGYSSPLAGQMSLISNCHVKGATVTSTYTDEHNDGAKAGGIIGYCVAGDKVSGCSVQDVTITGVRDVGGIAGCAGSSQVLTENSAEGVHIILDQRVVDETETWGFILGRDSGDGVVDVPESNTVSGENTAIELLPDGSSVDLVVGG